MKNPLLDDRDLDFQLRAVLHADALLTLPAFAHVSAADLDAMLSTWRRFARDVLLPTYRPMDEQPAVLRDGGVVCHPAMKALWPQLVDLGAITASRPLGVGGQQLPLTHVTAGTLYLMAANLSANGFAGLTLGAGHLIEAFGSDALKAELLPPLYEGRWTGTMALTEPQAGSSLADVRTRATPTAQGHFLVSGAKLFISGGDNDFVENVVHLTLARLDGAPAGTRGISLLAIPKKRRAADGSLVANDVKVTGLIHKLGWRGIPSAALAFGEANDCHGYLVGEAHQGLKYMFQMMNEARIMVGANGVATAAVAYQQAVAYAKDRVQGRPPWAKDPAAPPVRLVEHADVRRQLLRQKAIVEGGTALVLRTAHLADLAAHAAEPAQRHDTERLLSVLTPLTKTFPAEKGFESCALAVQVHGGYGYSSEYPVEAWLRDQKLNTLHEGTTGIQGLDLLGRKVVADGGEGWRALARAVEAGCVRAERASVPAEWTRGVREIAGVLEEATLALAGKALEGDVPGMLLHSADYLDAVSTWVVAWLWLEQAAAVHEAPLRTAFHEGKLRAAQYWLATELPRCRQLAALCVAGEDSYAQVPEEGW